MFEKTKNTFDEFCENLSLEIIYGIWGREFSESKAFNYN
jgi:hypothetical protein